jgi:membrane fusion protein (multidrug efflux system)
VPAEPGHLRQNGRLKVQGAETVANRISEMLGNSGWTARRIVLLAGIVAAHCGLGACSRTDAPPAPVPVAVNVVTVSVEPVALDLRYSARTRGEREVEVRARVSGILQKRYYREGEHVSTNALLFRIDPAPFAEEVGRLRGLEAVEKARLFEATAQRDRINALADKGVVSRRDHDAAVAAHATAYAAAEAATAALKQAQLNLSYTEVRAPIAGATGRESRSEGSLVEAGGPASLLTTIVQSDRLYVDFSLPENEAQMVRAVMQKRLVAVRLAPGSGGEIERAAKLEFLDSRVDGDSGTVPARAVLENETVGLAPGQFVLARIVGLESAPAVYIPVRAVLKTPDGAMVWTLGKDNRVAPRLLKLGHHAGNLVEVVDGLAAGDRVIVDGILKVAPDAIVKPSEIGVSDPPGGAAPAPAPVAAETRG